jgi:hypothetical protein
MTQTFKALNRDPRIVEPFSGISVGSLGDGATVLLLNGRCGLLQVVFRQIHALAIHEEFAHPLEDGDAALPQIPLDKGGYPLLVVEDSDWVRSFSDNRLRGGDKQPVHYLFLSMSFFVDVCSFIPPAIAWVDADIHEHLFGSIDALCKTDNSRDADVPHPR